MASAERRRGRRDNGLDATDWRAIEDLDPRLVEDVLDQLAARGIAAYVQPAMDVDPITRSATVPDRPSDRLFVDRRRAEAAREYLRGLLGWSGRPTDRPGDGRSDEPRGLEGDVPTSPARAGERSPVGPGRGDDVDAAFAGIVADFDRQVDPAAASWPAAEDVSEPAAPAGDRSGDRPGEWSATDQAESPGTGLADEPIRPVGPVDGREVTEPSLLDALDTFGAHLPDDDPPERFVPPIPPPLPKLSRQTVLGWIAIVVGLILLVVQPRVVPLDRANTMLLGFAAILGGAVALILRLRPDPDPDDPHPDDGAQV